MAMEELDDLMALFPDTDRTQVRDILSRNEAARVLLEGQGSIYKAMVGGDQAAIDAARQRMTTQPGNGGQQQQQNGGQQQQAAAIDVDDIWGKLSGKLDARLGEFFTTKQADIRTLAEKIADERVQAREGEILGKAAMTSDSVYQIRRSHEKEFGEELDTAKFKEYLDANPNKFASLSTAHDSYVQQKRIDKAIADGIAKGIETAATNAVAGHSAPPDTMMGGMIANNTKRIDAAQGTTNGQARGEHLDAAAKAFRAAQNKRAAGGETMA